MTEVPLLTTKVIHDSQLDVEVGDKDFPNHVEVEILEFCILAMEIYNL